MIILHGFGPAFGLSDGSPFVLKAELLLKMAGLPYRLDTAVPVFRAPRGKLPFITDGGEVVSDSTLIRFHLERRHGIDFDAGASTAQRGAAWLAEKACEDGLYFAIIQLRWLDPGQFDRGPRQFFAAIPAPLRPLVMAKVRRDLRRSLQGQGVARLQPAERWQIVARGLQALAETLGGQDFFGGTAPCGSDAGIAAMLWSLHCPTFPGPHLELLPAQPALLAYAERMRARFYPAPG